MARSKVSSLMTSYLRKMSLAVLGRTTPEGRHHFSEEYVREWCANHQSRFVTVNGVELHYRDEGEGPVLLLIHGFGGSLHNWNEWVGLLKGRYRIVRFDLPGFGLSSPVRRRLEIQWFVDVLEAFLDHLGIDRCFICGNSMGGWLAWEFTARFPHRVQRLVLMNAAGYFEEGGKPAGIELMAKDQFRKLLRSGAPKLLVRQIAKGSFGDKSKMTDDLVTRIYLMVNREGMLASLIYIASSDARSSRGKVHQIQTPTLILWGDKDQVIPPRHADLFYSDLPHSKLIVYRGVGHVPMMEVPERSAQDLCDFIEQAL